MKARKQTCPAALRLLSALCAFALLPLGAWAETSAFAPEDYVTLGELRTQALEGWQETFTVGEREVKANVTIGWMPEADACPIVEIAEGTANDDPALVKKYRGKDNSVNIRTQKPSISLEGDTDGSSWFIKPYSYSSGGTSLSDSQEYAPGQTPPADARPEGLDMTYEEMMRFVEDIILPFTGIGLDQYLLTVHIGGIVWKGREKDGEWVRTDQMTRNGTWSICGYQLFEGIPCLRSPGALCTYFTANVYTPECYNVCQHATVQKAVLMEDVPLLSFDAIKRVLAAQIEAGNLWGVDEMEFCYLPFQQQDADGTHWVLRPMWRVLGGYTDDPNTQKHVMPYYDPRDTDGSLTVPESYYNYYYNAQTGEMLHIRNANRRAPLAPDVLTWKEVR